jgi:hypothetical protein
VSTILGDSLQSCEFFVGLSGNVDELAGSLAEVGLHGNGTSRVPVSGDSVTLSYPLWPGTAMRSFMFTDGAGLLPSYADSQHRIDFIQLVPLFDEELEFKKRKGEAALWRAFEAAGVPYWDPRRVALQFN